MKEFKHGQLRTGSSKGPLVQRRDQAMAIALNEARTEVAKHLHPKSIRVSHKNSKGPTKTTRYK